MIKNLNTGKEEQGKVRITQEQADELNIYKDEYKVRYILAEKKEDSSNIKEIYTKEVGKKPFGGWSDEVIAEKLEEFRKNK